MNIIYSTNFNVCNFNIPQCPRTSIIVGYTFQVKIIIDECYLAETEAQFFSTGMSQSCFNTINWPFGTIINIIILKCFKSSLCTTLGIESLQVHNFALTNVKPDSWVAQMGTVVDIECLEIGEDLSHGLHTHVCHEGGALADLAQATARQFGGRVLPCNHHNETFVCSYTLYGGGGGGRREHVQTGIRGGGGGTLRIFFSRGQIRANIIDRIWTNFAILGNYHSCRTIK